MYPLNLELQALFSVKWPGHGQRITYSLSSYNELVVLKHRRRYTVTDRRWLLFLYVWRNATLLHSLKHAHFCFTNIIQHSIWFIESHALQGYAYTGTRKNS